jgi:ParB family chromosome partitioning protein
MNIALIPLEQVQDNPYQPRQVYNAAEIEALAVSIATDDLKQFPRARAVNSHYELEFGHKRARAFAWLASHFDAQGLPDRYDRYTNLPVILDELSDEEMYRAAVLENAQRSDISPIEQARAMKIYRDQFGKTSDEIGQLFGMSGATVRGKLRLLDLAEPVQQALTQGQISEGAARALLSAQKVANAEDVSRMMKEIIREQKSVSPMPADMLVEEYIAHRDSAIQMHGRWGGDDGKPRAGRDLWLLDMKNFPNKLLPIENTVQGICKAAGIEYNEIFEDDFANLPNPLAVAKDWIENSAWAPIYAENGRKLEHYVNPPACTACPFYAQVRGSHFCGLKACHARKEQAWKAHTLIQASKALGIAIYQPEDGKFKVAGYEDEKLFNKRHADLRLMLKHEAGYSYGQYNWKGLPELVCVVLVGQSRAQKYARGEKTSSQSAQQKLELKLDARHDEMQDALLWEAGQIISATLFDGWKLPALKALAEAPISWGSRCPDNIEEDEDNAVYLRTLFTFRMLFEASVEQDSNSLVEFVEVLAEASKSFGVRLPVGGLNKLARQYDAELAALRSGDGDE